MFKIVETRMEEEIRSIRERIEGPALEGKEKKMIYRASINVVLINRQVYI